MIFIAVKNGWLFILINPIIDWYSCHNNNILQLMLVKLYTEQQYSDAKTEVTVAKIEIAIAS